MLATSLEWVRRNYYDFFFTVHHLYLVFLLFLSFHCSWWMDSMIIPILLFFLDRFFRAVQSRKEVDVLSAKVLTSGAIELTIAKPARTNYHALSFVYLVIPSVSKWMWHPFNVASSPLDGTNQIVIYIKPLGAYTEKLHDLLVSSKGYIDPGKKVFKCPFSFKVGVEGSYGSESMFYLRYQSLVMIAGGIGVTPFLAIIRDIFHRYRLKQEDLPTSVDLIFCVKWADELHILNNPDLDSIFPGYQEHVRLTVYAYVTQAGVEGSNLKGNATGSQPQDQANKPGLLKRNDGSMYQNEDIVLLSDATHPKKMSGISSTGHKGWVFKVFAITIAGYLCSFGTFHLKIQSLEDSGVVRTMMYMVCIFIAVVICAGAVILVWSIFDKKADLKERDAPVQSPVKRNRDVENTQVALWENNLVHGRRPVWDDVFDDLTKRYPDQNVGVMVSGLTGLQQDVAIHCRRRSSRRNSPLVFHYHSVSFDL